jgi:hypothetical protein
MGTFQAVPEPPEDIEAEIAALLQQLPHLQAAEYGVEWAVKSRSTDDYNCLAWAMGDCEQNWSPALEGGYHWPDDLIVGVPVLDVVAEVFRRAGYAVCDDAELSPGIEKVALYSDAVREVRHAARQIPSGWWVSKLGDLADIAHVAVDAVECGLYGRVTMILCRPIDLPPPAAVRRRLILP